MEIASAVGVKAVGVDVDDVSGVSVEIASIALVGCIDGTINVNFLVHQSTKTRQKMPTTPIISQIDCCFLNSGYGLMGSRRSFVSSCLLRGCLKIVASNVLELQERDEAASARRNGHEAHRSSNSIGAAGIR